MILETKALREQAQAANKTLPFKIEDELEQKIKTFPDHSKTTAGIFRQDFVRGMEKEDQIAIKTVDMLADTDLVEFQAMKDGYSVYRAGDKIILVKCEAIGVK